MNDKHGELFAGKLASIVWGEEYPPFYGNSGGVSTQPYEYSNYNNSDEQSPTFDNYMIPEEDLELGQSRLLEVDNRVVVPAKTHPRLIITSVDALHSQAVPSLGIKCDAILGRLN
ncbi:hypothetical protein SUGI_0511010 [Cryptomeria japonica]|uniref:cytochrome c oxidase subunit 2-like n=1 Tax=Cryptomeria japonica TaxID=3369 RepID=UPI002408BCAC|nr:cytochrome c oxidase subunit 2-like [Cryptomeria japonica]GLJ26468.1 hypothetical protein SUGI_0511010 [Cryptomeria japonica]